MKRAVITALTLSLLSGTSALAQDANSGVVRMAREMAARSGGEQRVAPPPRGTRQQQAPRAQAPRAEPRQAPQARPDRSESRPRPTATQAPRVREPQGQRPSNQWQGQRPGSQATPGDQGQRPQWQGQRPGGQSQSRPGNQNRPESQARPGQRPDGQGRPGGQGAGRPESRPDQVRNPNLPPVVGFAQEMARNGLDRDRADRDRRNNDRGRWENDRDRDWDRRPVIRPEDRRDRDRNRPRYDERRFPRYVTPQQRYRWNGPVWRAPVGYYSFNWQWGQTLPWSWYTPNYYLNDYWRYGLPMPPIGCEWVRVGDDAILVDVFNGRIYQVVRRLFW